MKFLKKSSAFVLSAAMLTMFLPISVSASAAQADDLDSISSITVKTSDDGTVAYYDEDGNEVSLSDLNREVGAGNTVLPSKYDLRDYDRSTPVRDQGAEGYCWAFASTASVESNILSQPSLAAELGDNASQTLHLSESATAYFITTNISDESSLLYNDYIPDTSAGSEGGSPIIYALGLSAGYGTYPQSLCPYYDSSKAHFSELLRYYSSYALEDYSEFSSDDINGVKAQIIKNGAVAVGYWHNSEYFSDDMTAYFMEESASGSGHEVTVIGWDDNYSKENFNEFYQPENDGAWLCKNSWGEDFHDGGYFWMSYENYISDFAGFTVQSNDEFDNRYQNSCDFSTNEYQNGYTFSKSANIFTAESSEKLEQVSIGTVGKYDYKISVYKLNSDFTNPEDGTLLTTVSGSEDLTGIHTVYITDDVYLQSGDVFSVVVENAGDSDSYLMVDDADKNRTAKTAYYDYGNGWCDYVNMGSYDGSSTLGVNYYIGYPMIKAFTKNTDNSAQLEALSSEIESAEAVLAAAPDEAEQSDIDALTQQIAESKTLLADESCGAVEINNSIILLNKAAKKVKYAVYYINSLDDYYTLAQGLYDGEVAPKKIVLNTDLDFEGEDSIIALANSEGSFTAEFDGGGHTVKNADIVRNDNFSETEIYGFFGITQDTEISNLNFENCTSQYTVVCNSMDNVTLKSVSVTNSSVGLDDSYTDRTAFAFGRINYALPNSVVNNTIEDCSVVGCTIKSYYAYEMSESADTEYINCRAENNILMSYVSCSMFDNDSQSYKTISVMDDSDYSESYTAVLKVENGEISVCLCSGDESTVTAGEGTEIISEEDGVYVCRLTDSTEGYVVYNRAASEDKEYFDYILNLDTGKFAIRELHSSFFDDGMQKLEIPSSLFGIEVTEVLGGFVSDYTDAEEQMQVTELIVPDTITKVGIGAFTGFSNLSVLTIGGGIKEIAIGTWPSCGASLCELNLSEGLEVIGEDMFSGSSIESLTFPDSLKEIGDRTFKGISITKFTLGKNIESIGEEAIGYTMEDIPWENSRCVQVPDVVINGYSGTAAEKYAKLHGFTFVNLDEEEADMQQVLFDYGVFARGDVNLDGKVTVEDVTELQKYLAKITEFNDIQLANCRVYTCEATLDIRNATAIQKYLAGIFESLELFYGSSAKG